MLPTFRELLPHECRLHCRCRPVYPGNKKAATTLPHSLVASERQLLASPRNRHRIKRTYHRRRRQRALGKATPVAFEAAIGYNTLAIAA